MFCFVLVQYILVFCPLFVIFFFSVKDVNARTSQPKDDKALRAFSIAGSILSMVGLIITIITLLVFK